MVQFSGQFEAITKEHRLFIDIGRLKDYLPFYQTINALLDRLFMNSIWPMISMSMTIIAMITYCSRSLKLKPIYHIYTYFAQYLHSIRYAHIWTVDVFFLSKNYANSTNFFLFYRFCSSAFISLNCEQKHQNRYIEIEKGWFFCCFVLRYLPVI